MGARNRTIVIPSPYGDNDIVVQVDLNNFRSNAKLYKNILQKRGEQNCNLQNYCGSAGTTKNRVGYGMQKVRGVKAKKEKVGLFTELVDAAEAEPPENTKSWVGWEMQEVSGLKIKKEKVGPYPKAADAAEAEPAKAVAKMNDFKNPERKIKEKQTIIIPSPYGNNNVEIDRSLINGRSNLKFLETILSQIGEEFVRKNCNLENCGGSAGSKISWVGCEMEKKKKDYPNGEAVGDEAERVENMAWHDMQKISGVKIKKEKVDPYAEVVDAAEAEPAKATADIKVEKELTSIHEITHLEKPALILDSDTKPSNVLKYKGPVIVRGKLQLDPKLDKSRGFHNYFQSYLTNHTSSNLLTCLHNAATEYGNLTESTQIKYREMTVPVLQTLHPAEPAVKKSLQVKNNIRGDVYAQESYSKTTKLNLSSLKVFSRSFVNFFTNVCKENAEVAPEALLESAKIDYIDHFTTKKLKKIAEMKKTIKFWTKKAQQENEKLRYLSKYSQPKMKKERTHRKKHLPAKFINREVNHSSKKEKEKLKLNARGEPHHYVPSHSKKRHNTNAGKVDKPEKTTGEEFNLKDLVREAEVLYNVPARRRKRQRIFELEEDTNASSVGDIFIFAQPPKRARYWNRACERHHGGPHTPEFVDDDDDDDATYKRYFKRHSRDRHAHGRKFH